MVENMVDGMYAAPQPHIFTQPDDLSCMVGAGNVASGVGSKANSPHLEGFNVGDNLLQYQGFCALQVCHALGVDTLCKPALKAAGTLEFLQVLSPKTLSFFWSPVPALSALPAKTRGDSQLLSHIVHARLWTHFRFIQGWDEACIAQLKRAEQLAGLEPQPGSHKRIPKGVVLSMYPGMLGRDTVRKRKRMALIQYSVLPFAAIYE